MLIKVEVTEYCTDCPFYNWYTFECEIFKQTILGSSVGEPVKLKECINAQIGDINERTD